MATNGFDKMTKALLILFADLREDVDVMRLALAANGVILTADLDLARQAVKPIWDVARDEFRKLGEPDGPTLDELLRKFEGPLQ